MVAIVSYIAWAVVSYFVSKKVMENNPELNINPWNYGALSFAFGFLIAMSVLVYKWAKLKNNVGLQFLTCLVIGLTILLNIIMIF